MNQTVSINYGEILTSNFNRAVNELEEEYGFGGLAWYRVVASDDFEILIDFLNADGLHAELVEEEEE